MIVDWSRFVGAEKSYWDELEQVLAKLESNPEYGLSLAEVQRLHYLYERCSGDLVRLDQFSEPRLRASLESLVARAYGAIYETRAPVRIRWKAAIYAFPRAFRRHLGAFQLAVGITILGCAFGWFAIRKDPQTKAVLMPFSGLMISPRDRVAIEESSKTDRLTGVKASFSGQLMTHNIQVAIMTMAAGITWGSGTFLLLFYNGVILGAVAADYIAGGQGTFLAGWLLPHGSVEIPAILLGGQAGFILAGALIGWGSGLPRSARLRAVAGDLFAIIAGAACLLVWAGMVEAFVSQYHQPVLPYTLKIAFGVCELAALAAFLGWTGRE
ncbi:MAG TPA: stage II sporulation protein M [Bryobacteraceae bacterium]|nr:stage II sporulation protein M [Bryobacteraceae bacterium]